MAVSSESHLENTIQSLDDQDPYSAMDESYAGLQDMENMENAMKFKVPIKVDYNCGKTWYDAH